MTKTINELLGRALVTEFRVHGAPAPEPRPRVTRQGRAYVPPSAHRWKDDVRAACVAEALRSRFGASLETGPLRVEIEFFFGRPKSHFRTGRHATRLRDAAPRHHVQRPDVDNLAKAVLDSIGSWAGLPPLVWCDDSQVVELDARKYWSNVDEPPGAFVRVWRLDP